MRTFNSEYHELLKWYFEESNKIDKIPWDGGKDGAGTEERLNLKKVYRCRLEKLKKDYDVNDVLTFLKNDKGIAEE